MKIQKYQTGTPNGGILNWQQVMLNTNSNYIPHFLLPRSEAQFNAISQEEINRKKKDKKLRESELKEAELLSKSLHMWNWTGPFMNTSSTNTLNAITRFNFNTDATKGTTIVGLTTASAPLFVPGGSFWTKGILWLNPSRYLGKGSYTTALGGLNASLAGAMADNALASYGAVEALQHFHNNPNFLNGTMAILAGLPTMAISPAMLEHYLNTGKILKWEDLLEYMNSESAKWLFKTFLDYKKTKLPFKSSRLTSPLLKRWNTIFKVASEGLKGKKGVKKLLDSAKEKDPKEILLEAIRNKIVNNKTGETYLDLIKKSAKETGINWSDDAVLNPGNYMSGMDTEFKLGYVGGNEDLPFIERYYKNVVENILGEKGFLAKLIKSGDLRRTPDGKGWEALLRDGKYHELKHPEEYVKVKYALSKGANVDIPIPVNSNDLYPIHGTRDKNIKYLTSPSSLPGQTGYWTFIRNSKYSKSDAPGYYKGTGYSVPFFWTKPQYETAPMLPHGNHISNSYGIEAKELFRYMLNLMKVYRPTKVKDSAAPRGMIDEYNFGPQVPNPKSSWNTLDFEPGKGPFAFMDNVTNNNLMT